jgi:hypothetical protein
MGKGITMDAYGIRWIVTFSGRELISGQTTLLPLSMGPTNQTTGDRIPLVTVEDVAVCPHAIMLHFLRAWLVIECQHPRLDRTCASTAQNIIPNETFLPTLYACMKNRLSQGIQKRAGGLQCWQATRLRLRDIFDCFRYSIWLSSDPT